VQRGFQPFDGKSEGSDVKFGARRGVVHPLQEIPSRPIFEHI
jgi:hypothetical protein